MHSFVMSLIQFTHLELNSNLGNFLSACCWLVRANFSHPDGLNKTKKDEVKGWELFACKFPPAYNLKVTPLNYHILSVNTLQGVGQIPHAEQLPIMGDWTSGWFTKTLFLAEVCSSRA